MGGRARWKLSAPVAWLVSRHGKARALRPVLGPSLGVGVRTIRTVDTDAFGAFSREVERRGAALQAARAKIDAGSSAHPGATVLLASEGSFGPHPAIPFLALGEELVLLKDLRTGLEVAGQDIGPSTNFAHRFLTDPDEAVTFARSCGFPAHGMIVLGARDRVPDPGAFACKTARTPEALAEAVARAVDACGSAFVETDMRAHRNPTRMTAIRRAARDLVRRLASVCPECAQPGFWRVRTLPGLPCSDCGAPTRRPRAEVLRCDGCGYEEERKAPGEPWADPGSCAACNP